MRNNVIRNLIIIISIITLWSCSKGEIGKTYQNLSELESAQDKMGFVRTGKFGNNWPAKVIEVKKAMNEIDFLRNGRTHRYRKFDGYELKVIRLVTEENKETIIVFKSKNKK